MKILPINVSSFRILVCIVTIGSYFIINSLRSLNELDEMSAIKMNTRIGEEAKEMETGDRIWQTCSDRGTNTVRFFSWSLPEVNFFPRRKNLRPILGGAREKLVWSLLTSRRGCFLHELAFLLLDYFRFHRQIYSATKPTLQTDNNPLDIRSFEICRHSQSPNCT